MKMKAAIEGLQVTLCVKSLHKSKSNRPASGYCRAKALHARVHISAQAREAARRAACGCNVHRRRSYRLLADGSSCCRRRFAIVVPIIITVTFSSSPPQVSQMCSSPPSAGNKISPAIAELEKIVAGAAGKAIGHLTVLTTCSLLLPLPLETAVHLLRCCTLQRFTANGTILQQGKVPQCLMIVLGGSVSELCDVTFAIVPSVSLKPENRRCG